VKYVHLVSFEYFLKVSCTTLVLYNSGIGKGCIRLRRWDGVKYNMKRSGLFLPNAIHTKWKITEEA